MPLGSDPGLSPRSDPPCDYVSGLIFGSKWAFLLPGRGPLSGAVFELEAVVAGLEDVAVVAEPIEEGALDDRNREHRIGR